uniref:Clan AA aspartic protease, AF_0612 family n=1 Tax=Candidatus Kentrum sp. DK TaxID=2126562 RepID=A0A450SI27_9GAMM|nr:MAG: clan AA aspartic protease, AF_0612 family [Candidatus Kentron sp. DK]VFJ68008.1 MAG: clan AA aspartic protease, AF_0612 family [Candidatus Kentron sp. DK]
MGYVHAEITLKNPRLPARQLAAVTAMVDTGALMLCLPQRLVDELSLEESTRRKVVTADGSAHMVPYVGPVEVIFEDRRCFVGALVLGDEVLLGAMPMEDMDLIVSPTHRKLVANPASPDFPHALVKANREKSPCLP